MTNGTVATCSLPSRWTAGAQTGSGSLWPFQLDLLIIRGMGTGAPAPHPGEDHASSSSLQCCQHDPFLILAVKPAVTCPPGLSGRAAREAGLAKGRVAGHSSVSAREGWLCLPVPREHMPGCVLSHVWLGCSVLSREKTIQPPTQPKEEGRSHAGDKEETLLKGDRMSPLLPLGGAGCFECKKEGLFKARPCP